MEIHIRRSFGLLSIDTLDVESPKTIGRFICPAIKANQSAAFLKGDRKTKTGP